MDKLTIQLAGNFTLSGNIAQDVTSFLGVHNAAHTVDHSARVATTAHALAPRFQLNPYMACQAGWLHDISAVIPNAERLMYAEVWNIDVLPEERVVPMIVHQKLSAHIAHHIFRIDNHVILNAIGCHTTLKQAASSLDKLVFIADKLAWDGIGEPPYKIDLETQLAESLDAAARWYVSYLWEHRANLQIIHPWLAAAYKELAADSATR